MMGNTDSGSAGRVKDATRLNWVDRFAPPGLRPYLRLSRADRPIGTWLLVLPCWWTLALSAAGDGRPDGLAWLVLASTVGAFLMRGAGCTWNDLSDREFDARVERTRSRPLPSGQVTPRGAAVWMIAQALAAFGILITFNGAAIGWGVASLGLVAIYPFAKRFTWWPQVFLGLAFNWGALLMWVAATGGIGWPAVWLYLAGIAWTLHYDTIYAHQDKDDDALIGVKSTARLFGAATKRWLWGFGALSVGLASLAVVSAGGGALSLLGVAAFAGHLVWQTRTVDIDDPEHCLMVFRASRYAGILLLAGLVLDAVV